MNKLLKLWKRRNSQDDQVLIVPQIVFLISFQFQCLQFLFPILFNFYITYEDKYSLD